MACRSRCAYNGLSAVDGAPFTDRMARRTRHQQKSGTPIGKPERQMAATSWYFAYASNMSRAQMQSRAGNILEAQTARLENYEIVFNKKSHGGLAQGNRRPAAGEGVYGEQCQNPRAADHNIDEQHRRAQS